jgi:hypothetical protein
MRPKRIVSFFAAESDAELEWLLCLAAALQAREQRAEKLAAKRKQPPKPTL